MPAGSLGDQPLTDLLVHGRHPFPPDIEALVLRLRDFSPRYLDQIELGEFIDWASNRNLDAGRKHLNQLLAIYQADLERLLKSK
jgi:hypothetical protein